MGDWDKPRKGITKRERGIPVDILDQIIIANRFKIVHESRCDFSLTSKLNPFVKDSIYNSTIIVNLDKVLSNIFSWNKTYHATSVLKKLRPCSKSYVLAK